MTLTTDEWIALIDEAMLTIAYLLQLENTRYVLTDAGRQALREPDVEGGDCL